MSTRIELLTALQRLDQVISQKVRDAAEASRQRLALEETAEQKAGDVERLKAELAEVQARQRALERELDETEEKMKDRRMRLERIRNEKELQATRREIEVLKERTAAIEEEDLTILEQVEALTARVGGAEEALEHGRRALADEREGLMAREAALAAEVDRERQARTALLTEIDGNLLRRYEVIFARRGGSAVVAVRGGTCQGCHMNVPPQLCNQILRGQEIFACPSCQRLLFPDESRADEA